MVLVKEIVQQNLSKSADLRWTEKYERQLKKKVDCAIKNQSDHFSNFTTQLLKECYHSGFTNKKSRTLAERFNCCRETVKRNLRHLQKLGAIQLFKTMSRITKLDSSYIVVINWQYFDYYPPREYDINSLQRLHYVALVQPSDKKHINGLFVLHNINRKAIEQRVKRLSKLKQKWEENTMSVSAGSNVLSACEINPQKSTEQSRKTKKIDEQKPTANAEDYLKNLISNLSLEFLSIIDELGFNARWYICDHFNRDAIHKAFCRVLWQLHRNYGDDALIKTCFYAFQYKEALFHEFSTAKRLAANFKRIRERQKQGIKLIAEITFPCRLKRYTACYE